MENSKLKQRKVANKKNDLLTKLQEKIKKKVKGKVKRNEKRKEGLNGIRQCCKSGLPEHRRLRNKGAPGHEGMFLKGLRTKYIRREKLNEANEARKNEDINKIIDIGRVFQKRGKENGDRKRVFNRKSAPENRKSQKILEKDLTKASEDFNKCSLSAISAAETTDRLIFNTDSTIILQENNPQTEKHNSTIKKKKLNLDKELVMFSLLYEEKVGSQLLPRLMEHDVLEEAFKALRNIPEDCRQNDSLKNEFVKEFKFLKENPEPEIPLTEIFGEEFHNRNHDRVTDSDICLGFTERPIEDDSINLSGMEICKSDPVFTPSLDEEKRIEFQTKELEKHRVDLSITTPQIQFYRRYMF